jgi:hypothetical protein
MKNVEMLIIAGIVLTGGTIVGIVGCSTCATLSGDHTREAEKQGHAWGKELGLDVKAVKCAGSDSDGDGYISCTIVENLKNGETKLHNVECAGAYNLNESCRQPKLRMPGSQVQ